MPHISIKAEKIGEFFGFPITNSLLTAFILIFLILILVLVYKKEKRKKYSSFVFFVHFILKNFYQLFYSVTKKYTEEVFSLLSAFFLYILLSNWLGLLPGVGSVIIHHEKEHFPLLRGATADLNTTLALATVSVFAIQYYGIKHLGLAYFRKFINFSNPINFFVGVLEIISEFSKILSFAFRLFGNIFAGEVLLTIVAFLVPVLASFPFLILEVFVGFVQALVFSMLSAVFLSSAISSHH